MSVTAESPAYRALVHNPPCADAAVHARLVLDIYRLMDLPHLEDVARLIVETRLDEQDLPSVDFGMVDE